MAPQPNNVYIYILIMDIITYLERVLPLTLIKWEFKSPFVKSFLYYVPYATISAMTFPAIMTCTRSPISAGIAFVVALITSYFEKNMVAVAFLSCLSVYITECFII